MGTEISKPLMGSARILFDEGGGLLDLGNIPDISLDPAIKTLERYVSLNGEKVLDFTHVIGKNIGLKFKLDDFDDNNLARVFAGGAPADASVSAGSVTTPEVVVGYPGRYICASKGSISGCVLKNTGGTITYVDGTDYAVDDAVEGLIAILDGGAITPGQELKLTYDYAAVSQRSVIVLGKSIVEGSARMIFKTSKGKPFTWIIHRCELKIEGGMKLIVENWCDSNFVLNVLPSKNHPTEPFGRMIRRTV